MHTGCTGLFNSGREIVDKIRMMGFNHTPVTTSYKIACTNCHTSFTMINMETTCPSCGMVFGVTPCHSHNPQFVKPAGIGY